MKLISGLFIAAMFTASFEVILNVNVGGTLHISQVFLILFALAALLKVAADATLLWAPALSSLWIWAGLQILLLPMANSKLLGLELTIQMLVALAATVASVQIFGRSRSFETLMRWYLLSYITLALFGLLQFTLPLVGGPGIFVTQWMGGHRIARINGFNYEPSFYATYLLMGWVTLLELRSQGARVVADRRWRYGTVVLTAALLLSTSRTAYAIMAIELLPRLLVLIARNGRRSWRYLTQGRLVLPVLRARLLAQVALVLLLMVGVAAYLVHRVQDPSVFLVGTGIGGTASHSVDAREGQFQETLLAARQHPWLGRGLAGVPEQIAADRGHTIERLDEAKASQGFPAFLAIYTASGLFVFIPFVIFCYQASIGAMVRAWSYRHTEIGKWLFALGRATLIEFLALTVDQNIFRVYVWVHLAMVSVVGYRLMLLGQAARAQSRGLPAALPVTGGTQATA